MNKIICDICGTSYPDTAESCPICGYSQIPDLELTEEDLLMDEPLLTRNKGGRFVEAGAKRKGKEIFDYDRVNPQPEEDDEDEDEDEEDYEEEEEEQPRSSTGLVIVLVAFIIKRRRSK